MVSNKVVFFSFYYPPDLSAGSFRSIELVRQLSSKLDTNDELHVITTNPNRYSSFLKKVNALEVDGKTSIHRIKIPTHNNGMFSQIISFSVFAFFALRMSQKLKPNFLLGTSSRLMTGFLTFISARILGIRYYIDLRDIFSETISDLMSQKNVIFGRILKFFFIVLEKKVLKNASGVNIVSKGFLEYFKKLGLNTSEWTSYSNGIDKEFLSINKKNIKKNKKNKIILYAGNIGSGQGLEKIIPKLAKRFKHEYQFFLVGDGSTLALLKDIIKKENIKNVRLLSPVERVRLIEYYKDADILFLHLNDMPAFNRVLPSKLFEYAAVGKPIIAGVNGYPKKFINENLDYAFTFSPGDLGEASSAIISASKCEPVLMSKNNFIKKYSRAVIMNEMSQNIINLIKS